MSTWWLLPGGRGMTWGWVWDWGPDKRQAASNMAASTVSSGPAMCLSLLPSQAGNVELPNWGTTMLWGIMSCLVLVMLLIIQFINLELKKKKLKKTPVRGSKKQTSFHNTGPVKESKNKPDSIVSYATKCVSRKRKQQRVPLVFW